MIIDAQYLPCIEYFSVLSAFDEIQLEVYENYQKQTYRNRCKILTADKIDNLVIPVSKNKPKEIVKNIRIDYSQDWTRQHLGAIKAAYGKAPFFEHFFDYFRKVFEQKPDFLIDLNFELLTVCLKLLEIKKIIVFSAIYEDCVENDFRGTISPKTTLNKTNNYKPRVYAQNFGEDFVPNLSIIDLLMCQGQFSSSIIEESKAKLNIFESQSV